MAQPLVLAIEPDLRQAAIVKRIVREKALAEVAVVDSRDAAIEAMRTSMPDVLLLSALMSPRDEDELIAHLKTLENAGHLQTHTIPQLASALEPGEERASRGLLSAFRRKKDPAPVAGCDPDLFADEIRVYLQRAADKKRQLQNTDFAAPDMRPSAKVSKRAAAESAEEPAAPSSSWSSPFEWKPAGSSARSTRTQAEAPRPQAAAEPPPVAAVPEPAAPEPQPASISVAPPAVAPQPETPAAEPRVVEPAATPALAAEPVVAPPLVATPAATEAPVVPLAAAAPEAAVEAAAAVVAPPPPAVAPPPAPREPIAVVKPAAARPAAAEPARPKPVADRPARVAARVTYQGLVKEQAPREREDLGRLGPLSRWARAEIARTAKSGPVTGDDVRTLISSLAVPAAVASVTYPSGCRIRRVRVPVSPDYDGGDGVGPVILSRQKLAEQRKQASAQ